MAKLKIIHCLRAPVGGLFRHVVDLAREQAARGHAIGIVCDSTTGGTTAEKVLEGLRPSLALGLVRVPMARDIGASDLSAYQATRLFAARVDADIIHGHGAKGGAYGRLAAAALRRAGRTVRCFYTPHGGSLHFERNSVKGFVFLSLERSLEPITDGLIFESRYAADTYAVKVGAPSCPVRLVPNGLLEAEFVPSAAAGDAADFLFIGELRLLKGVDLLIDALARLSPAHSFSAVIVGDGPDRDAFIARANAHGLGPRISFPGVMPARRAFAMGRCLVVPSRAESFPYIVLEAAAAAMPMIATRVGGIPEILSSAVGDLVAPDDVDALASAMEHMADDPDRACAQALAVRADIAGRFTVARMTDAVLDFYASATPSHGARALAESA
ncbi:MAG: glycosyltransferase family 4 protein [Hyphomicrobiaceae bacterium]